MTQTSLRPLRLLVLPLLALLLLHVTATGVAQAAAVPGSSPLVVIDQPAAATTGSSFAVSGWAIDTLALSSAGIDTVNLYLWPSDASGNVATGTQPIFSAAASYGAARTDIAGAYGQQFLGSGFSAQVPAQNAGSYLLAAFVHSNLVDNWSSAQLVLQVQAAAAPAPVAGNLLITMDSPAPGLTSASFTVAGWAIDTGATAGSGIDMVHVYVFGADAAGNVPTGATQVFFGGASLGGGRPDIAGLYGGQFGAAGFSLTVPALPDGFYAVSAYGHSALSGAWAVQSRTIQIGSAPLAAGSAIPAVQAQKGIPRP